MVHKILPVHGWPVIYVKVDGVGEIGTIVVLAINGICQESPYGLSLFLLHAWERLQREFYQEKVVCNYSL